MLGPKTPCQEISVLQCRSPLPMSSEAVGSCLSDLITLPEMRLTGVKRNMVSVKKGMIVATSLGLQ